MSLCRHGDGACIFGTGTRRGARGSAAPRVSHESVCFTLLTETDHRPFQATMKTAARKKRRRDSVSICKQNKTRCDERAEGQLSARGGAWFVHSTTGTAPCVPLELSGCSTAPLGPSQNFREGENEPKRCPKAGPGQWQGAHTNGMGMPTAGPCGRAGIKKQNPSERRRAQSDF